MIKKKKKKKKTHHLFRNIVVNICYMVTFFSILFSIFVFSCQHCWWHCLWPRSELGFWQKHDFCVSDNVSGTISQGSDQFADLQSLFKAICFRSVSTLIRWVNWGYDKPGLCKPHLSYFTMVLLDIAGVAETSRAKYCYLLMDCQIFHDFHHKTTDTGRFFS